MAIVVCSTGNCPSKVRTPKCHGAEMGLEGTALKCAPSAATLLK